MNVDASYLRKKIKGKIISFEGLDCSFKETNHRAFVKRLKDFIGSSTILIGSKDDKNNIMERIYTESFPRYDNESSYFVKQWLSGQYEREYLEPEVVCQLYAIDRFDYWNKLDDNKMSNLKRLENGACFIFDRYSSSNAMYNPRYKNPSYHDLEFDSRNYYNPNPNIVFMMVMNDFDKWMKLVAQKKNKDCNESDIAFLSKVYDNMEYLIDNDTFARVNINLIPVNCIDKDGNIKSRERLEDEIWTLFINFITTDDIKKG